MATTKKPTGLTITRSGLKLKAEWKIASENYGAGQQLQRKRFKKIKVGDYYQLQEIWEPITVSKTATKKTISDTAADLSNSEVTIRLRGRRSPYTTGSGKKQKTITPDWSDWVYETKSFYAPKKPSVTLAQGSSDGTCTLSWSVNTKSDDARPFKNIEWQTRIVNGKKNADWDSVKWKSGNEGWDTGTGGATGSATINNNVTFNDENSWTRVVRVRSIGYVDDSGWSYAYYTYATPYQAKIKRGTADRKGVGYTCNVSWEASESFAHPIDSFRIYYLIATPRNTSLDYPVGANWTEAPGSPYVDSTAKAQYTFSIETREDVDQCLWFRVDTVHGTRTKLGYPYRVSFGGIKPLSGGSALDVDYDSETSTLTLDADNPSEIPGTKVQVKIPMYNSRGSVSKYEYKNLNDETTVRNYTIPSSASKVEFQAYVVGGDYKSIVRTRNFYPKTQASAFAYAPTRLNLSAGSTAGTVDAEWNVPIRDATGASISYSDDPSAWDSGTATVVTATNTDSTTVTGLSYNVEYYFRVRLNSPRGETDWSTVKKFKLKSSDLPTPKSLALAIGQSKDSIKVTWKWTDFAQADAIAISWADDPNAWDSSSAPNEQEVSRLTSNGTFYISGLERDTIWYVRARYKVGEAYSGTYVKNIELPVETVAPADVAFTTTAVLNTPRLSWTWSWDDAESAELTWSDNPNAWDATEGLSRTTVDKSRTFIDIPNLATGKVWYAKVRFIFDKWSSESDIVSVDLRTDPMQPAASLSDTDIPAVLGKTDISWSYFCEDGMAQSGASVWLVQENGTLISQIASVNDERTAVTVYADGLTGDTDYWIAVQTASATGKVSPWSAPVKLHITNKPIAAITQSSLQELTLEDDEGDEYTVMALTEMPLTLSVTGITTTGKITAYVERADDYFIEQPDENQFRGHQGEVVLITTRDTDGDIEFGVNDMIGALNDGAAYTLTAVVKDYLGQTDEASIDFTVLWSHQALIPTATVVVDQTQMISKITPIAPTGAEDGDSVDIYRLSADKPELIVEGAIFGTTYVDPYPSFGPTGGHRIVYRTVEGDYTTETDHLAMRDYTTADDAEYPEDILDIKKAVIDFGGERITLQYRVDLSSKWQKDFVETKYLGGSVQGDWNPAVSRTGSVSSVAVTTVDQDLINSMRRLAAYAGVCHVRTPDGSSYSADIQVSEDRSHDTLRKIVQFSLDITRVDSERYDGMTLEDWEAE